MIEVNCPHCGHLLRIPSKYAGQQGACRHCRGRFQVPMLATPSGAGSQAASAEPGRSERSVYPQPVQQVPDAGEPSLPAAMVQKKRSGRKPAIAIVCGLVLVSAVAAAVALWPRAMNALGGKKAETPKDAVVNFAAALDQGNVNRMLRSAHYTDEEGVKAACRLMADMRAFEKALDKAFGKPQPGEMQMSGGRSFFTPDQINSADFQIQEGGDTATAHLSGELGKDTHLIKKDGYWYVDLATDAPTGAERDQAIAMVENLSEAAREAKAKIGQPGTSRQQVEAEFFGRLMGAALGMTDRQEPPPPAGYASWDNVKGETLDKSDPLYAAVQGANDALATLDLQRFKQYVSKDCRVPMGGGDRTYWEMAEQMKQQPEMLEAMRETKTTIEKVEVLARTPDEATLRITAVSRGGMGGGKGTGRNVYRKLEGKWMLTEVNVEGFSFSTSDTFDRPDLKIPASDVAQYIAAYPGVRFSEVEDIPFGTASGPLFDTDESALTALQGVTQDATEEVVRFYSSQMQGTWQDFRPSSGIGGSGAEMKTYNTLMGERTLPDGKRVGVNVRLEEGDAGTDILIVMGPAS